MIARYTLPEMAAVWSDQNRFQKWLDVEIAVCEVLAERGEIPKAAVARIKKKARFEVERIHEIEHVTRHDVIAFVSSVAESVGDDSRFIHLGLTSTDVVDTAQGLVLADAWRLIAVELDALMTALQKQAFEHRRTWQVGRTHGIHAEPTTFGLKLAVWYDEMRRNRQRLESAAGGVQVGKLSGAVGTFAHLDPKIEEQVCRRLGLQWAAASTQTLQRDRHSAWVAALATTASSYDKFATEVRHLQRTEVREVEEPFSAGQKGSSAMPHKRNPVTCEQICGLARIVRSHVQVALENQALWHERDISHSSAERVILADSAILLHYMTRKMTWLLSGWRVYPERMRVNLESMKGLVFSGQVLVELARAGVLRDEAYVWVQRNAMRVWDEDRDFKELLLEDPDISRVLSRKQIDRIFQLESLLKNTDVVFRRVFGKSAAIPR
ncbi:MAG: adenylosuccinate lyase [Acidobacteriota bacterium]